MLKEGGERERTEACKIAYQANRVRRFEYSKEEVVSSDKESTGTRLASAQLVALTWIIGIALWIRVACLGRGVVVAGLREVGLRLRVRTGDGGLTLGDSCHHHPPSLTHSLHGLVEDGDEDGGDDKQDAANGGQVEGPGELPFLDVEEDGEVGADSAVGGGTRFLVPEADVHHASDECEDPCGGTVERKFVHK